MGEEPQAMAWLPVIELVVEALKAIAWPIAAVVIAHVFRGELKQLFTRMTKVSLSGAEFSASVAKQNDQRRPIDLDELKNLPGRERTPAMASLEVELHESLGHIAEDDKIDVLVSELARARLDIHCLIVYRSIFGSQIGFLKFLRENGGNVKFEAAEKFFESIQPIDAIHADRTTIEFVSFLCYQNLVNETDDGYSLTDRGNDFLFFLFRSALPENLPF